MKQILALIDEARGRIGDLDDTRRTEAAALGEMPAGEHVGED